MIRSLLSLLLLLHVVGCGSAPSSLHRNDGRPLLYANPMILESYPPFADIETKDSIQVLDVDPNLKPPKDFMEYDIEPKIMKIVEAPYPPGAVAAQRHGNVFIKAWVTKTGIVPRASVVKSDDPEFNGPALRAIVQWRFEPAYLKGQTVDVWVSLPFRF